MKREQKQLIVVVTRKDISHGIPSDEEQCPIACALRRRYPAKTIAVNYDGIFINKRTPISITNKMELWMQRFDNCKPVKPTSFFLDAAV